MLPKCSAVNSNRTPSERIQYLWIPVGGISSSAEQRGAVNWCRSHYTNKQYEVIHTADISGKSLLVWFSVWLYLFSGRVSRVLPTCFGWRTTASWGFSLLKAAGGKYQWVTAGCKTTARDLHSTSAKDQEGTVPKRQRGSPPLHFSGLENTIKDSLN